MNTTRIFGTDGIRGRAGEGWLSAAAVSALGRAAGAVLGGNGSRRKRKKSRVLLGHDGRRSGPELVAALAEGFGTAGFAPSSVGLITTPGLAWLARENGFDAAAMLSASHNPAEDNGIKLFSGSGEKFSDELEFEVEARLVAEMPGAGSPEEAARDGGPPAPAVPRVPELELAYLTHLVEVVAADLKLDGVNLVLDCANGGGSRVAPRVFGRLGAQVTSIHAEPDGDNINRECGSTHPGNLREQVAKQKARLGIALDGDGDRCILVDERGQIVHGDGILTVCGRFEAQAGRLRDPRVVATVMSNRGLHRALREVGVSVVTVDVGDRNVVECLRREGLRLGGEQSGHIVFGADHGYLGDGIYTALRVLKVMQATGKPLSELAASYQPFPQVLSNVPVARKPLLSQIPRVAEAVERIEAQLGEDGRVLMRYSGTEPLARVMIEGPDADDIQRFAAELVELLAAEIGA